MKKLMRKKILTLLKERMMKKNLDTNKDSEENVETSEEVSENSEDKKE